jgi:hypothetical protein
MAASAQHEGSANPQNMVKFVMLKPSPHFCWYSFINPRNIASLNGFETHL